MHEPSVAVPPGERPVSPQDESAEGADETDPSDDARLLQILSTEHWSLLSARSLAYNEAFTRVAMFMTFLSMSFVALALLAQAMGFTRDFLVIAALVVGADFLVGLLSYLRVAGTGVDDLRATHGMNRIRHGYVQIAPRSAQYFVTGTSDDAPGVMKTYGFSNTGRQGVLADLAYGFSTSLGMLGVIVSLVGGVEAALLTLLVGGGRGMSLVIGGLTAVAVLVIAAAWTVRAAYANQEALDARFPSEEP